MINVNASEPSLCQTTETIIFSCASGKNIISVCTSKVFNSNEGYLTYKFGENGEAMELSHTAEARYFEDEFKFSYSGYAKGSTYELSFSVDEYLYTVHSDLHVYRDDSSGVFVENDSGLEAYYECNNSRQNPSHEWAKIYHAGFSIGQATHIGTKPP